MSGGPTADELTEGARGLRRITAELADPESELTGTAATRHRIEGAAAALEAAALSPTDRPAAF